MPTIPLRVIHVLLNCLSVKFSDTSTDPLHIEQINLMGRNFFGQNFFPHQNKKLNYIYLSNSVRCRLGKLSFFIYTPAINQRQQSRTTADTVSLTHKGQSVNNAPLRCYQPNTRSAISLIVCSLS